MYQHFHTSLSCDVQGSTYVIIVTSRIKVLKQSYMSYARHHDCHFRNIEEQDSRLLQKSWYVYWASPLPTVWNVWTWTTSLPWKEVRRFCSEVVLLYRKAGSSSPLRCEKRRIQLFFVDSSSTVRMRAWRGKSTFNTFFIISTVTVLSVAYLVRVRLLTWKKTIGWKTVWRLRCSSFHINQSLRCCLFASSPGVVDPSGWVMSDRGAGCVSGINFRQANKYRTN